MAQTVRSFEPLHINYTAEDGLRSNFIVNLFNDSKGVLWIATANGLSAYDGKHFRSIKLNNTRENFIARVGESPDGTIWFITLDGGLYSVAEETANPHPLNDRILEIFGSRSISIPYRLAFESNRRIFISSTACVIEVTDENAGTISKNSPGGRFLTRGGCLLGFSTRENNNNIPVPVEFGGKQYAFRDTTSNPFTKHIYSGNSPGAFAIAKGPYLWVFSNGEVRPFQFNAPVSNSIFFENDSVVWVGTEGDGAYRVVDGMVTDHVFPGSRIYAVLKDFEGGYWFGTDEKGLFYVPALEVSNFISGGKKLKAHFINSYDGQLTGLTEEFHLFRGADFSVPILEPVRRTGLQSQVFESGSCNCFSFTDHDHSKKVLCIDWRTRKMNSFTPYSNTVKMAVYGDDTLYSTYSRLKFRSGGREFRALGNTPVSRVQQLSPANDRGMFWVVSADGIYLASILPRPDTVVLSRSYTGLRGARALFDLCGSFIAAADDGYFYHLDTLTGKYNRLASAGRHEVYCFEKVSENRVLLGTAEGLVSMDMRRPGDVTSITGRNISRLLGLPGRLIKDIELMHDSVYCLSESEIFVLPLPPVATETARGAISFIRVAVNGIVQELQQLPELYTDGAIAFGIMTASFKDGNAYTYAFRLLPLDTAWKEATSEQLAFYNLPAGEYTLQVRDNYNKQAAFHFVVNRYFYETPWFLGMVVLALASLLASPFYFRNRLTVSRARMENEKNKLRLRALTSQLKPHFVFNALSSIQSYVLRKSPRESGNYLARFAMHIRHALEQASHDEIPLARALDSTRNYLDLERMRFEHSFDYRIHVGPDVNADELKIPVMLIQPYVENAVIHGMPHAGKEGLIEIDFCMQAPGKVLCTIRDNGRGLAADTDRPHNGNGLGTRINRERMQLLNALHGNRYEVNILQNTPEAGVTVTIQFTYQP